MRLGAENVSSRGMEFIQDMRVDRPFLFLVFDSVSGLVLAGVVVNSVVDLQG
jgi:serpin B